MKIISVAAACSLALSGCATQTFTMSGNEGKQPTKEEAQVFWVAGIGQEQTIDAAKVCGGADRVAKVETQLGPLNILLGFVTFGIFSPRDAKVYCK
jgi:Bor protein